jgi:hypothetical protein
MTDERRAPVQGYISPVRLRRLGRAEQPGDFPGTISWAEHEEAWRDYAKRYGKDQSAERLAQRGGFGYAELVEHLKRAPTTWRPR